MSSIIEVVFYTTSAGKQPFVEWQEKLELKVKAILITRLVRVRLGNFGDCEPLVGAQGLYELRIHYDPGYRIYFGKRGVKTVVMLIGGKKNSQARDVQKAKRFWLEYQELL